MFSKDSVFKFQNCGRNYLPQHFFTFFPLPQGHGLFLAFHFLITFFLSYTTRIRECQELFSEKMFLENSPKKLGESLRREGET